jgi:hypothetical protein
MAYMYQDSVGYPDPSKITISTWVYLSKAATEEQLAAAQALSDDELRAGGAFLGIPIMEFGNSIEPRVGIGIGMGMVYEGYLGFAYWAASTGIPSPPDHIAILWIGGNGIDRTGWFEFGTTLAQSSEESDFDRSGIALFSDPSFPGLSQMWKNVELVVGGIAESTTCSFFYPRSIDPGSIHPVVNYNGFNNAGINDFNVRNGDLDFPRSQYSHELATPSTWTLKGTLKNFSDIPRFSLKKDDIAQGSIEVDTTVLFWQFYPDPKNFTVQPVPTTGPNLFHSISVDTGGTGKYFDFGQIVVLFPQRQGVTYAGAGKKPSIPSVLYYDGTNIKFKLMGRWPENTTGKDKEIVPNLTFSGPGIVLDSWNHIFLSIDLETMVIAGGQDDPTVTTIEPILGFRVPAGLELPTLTVRPKFTMIVNGSKPTTGAAPPIIDFPIQPDPDKSGNPTAQLTMYPSKTGHWQSERYFKMQLQGGQVGFPIIPQEIGRYKVTGPNARIEYAYTQIWFNQAIESTDENMAKFFRRTKIQGYNGVLPPVDKEAAQNAFGDSDIWCYRDKQDDIKFQDNQGKGPDFTVVGDADSTTDPPRIPPFDYRPGPGQVKRTQTTDAGGDGFPFPITTRRGGDG